MPSKKERELIRERKEKQERQTRMIQMVGAGVIILLVVLVVWQALPKKQASTQSSAPVSVGDQTACTSFADIPVAQQYSQPPMGIDKTKQYFATVKMAKGGEFVGEMAILESAPRSATLKAHGDVRVLIIDGDAFNTILHDRPEVAVSVLRHMSTRVRELNEKVGSMAG